MKHLAIRAELYRKIRHFFYERHVLEVETPLLCSHTVTDIHTHSIRVENRFLQTSPEYAMKRLLAAGSGAIFQICKAFRQAELGSNHNPEFTMLEWYRPQFTHHELMQELDELMHYLLDTPKSEKGTYRDCFLTHTGIDPLTCETAHLFDFIQQHHILSDLTGIDRDTALQVILSHCIEPVIGIQCPFFIYDFPVSQACLAKIREDNPPVAERFELYYHGFELANGFHELTDPIEQQERFERDQAQRQSRNTLVPAIDHYLIDALKQGLPPVSGVAVGLDRIVMLAASAKTIQEVLSFHWENS